MASYQNRINVDIKKFTAVKILLNSGETQPKVADYMGLNRSTVSRIASVETFDEYKAVLAAIALKAREKAAEDKRKLKEIEEKKAAAAEAAKKAAARAAAESVKAVPAASLVPQTQTKPVDQVYGANRICELLTHQNELLKGIMNKVAFIVDELTGVSSPKDGDQK